MERFHTGNIYLLRMNICLFLGCLIVLVVFRPLYLDYRFVFSFLRAARLQCKSQIVFGANGVNCINWVSWVGGRIPVGFAERTERTYLIGLTDLLFRSRNLMSIGPES